MPVRFTEISLLDPTRLNQAQMDPAVAGAPARQLDELARGIGSVSKSFSDIANKLQDVRNANLEADIEQSLRDESAEIAKRSAADPTNPQHLKDAAAFAKRAAARLEQADVAPESRDRLRPFQLKMARHTEISVAETASRGVVAQGRAIHARRMTEATTDPDDGAIQRETERAQQAGVLSKDEAESNRVKAEAQRADWRVNQEIENDPGGWITQNGNPDRGALGFDGVKHANRIRKARGLQLENTMNIYNDAVQDIEADILTKPEDVNERTKSLHPVVGKKLREILSEKEKVARDAVMRTPEFQNQLAGKLGAKLRTYNGDDEDYDGGLIEITDGIRQMEDGPLKEQYARDLDGIRQNKRERAKTNADRYAGEIDKAWDNHGFGREPLAVVTADVGQLVKAGLLKDRAKLKLTGMNDEEIDRVMFIGMDGKPLRGVHPTDEQRMASFRKHYGSRKEKKAVDDPFLQSAFDTIAAGSTTVRFSDPLRTAETAKRNKEAEGRYGKAKKEFSEWLEANPTAGPEKMEAEVTRICSRDAKERVSGQILAAKPEVNGGQTGPPR